MTDVLQGFLKGHNVEDADFYTIKPISDNELAGLRKDYNVKIETTNYFDSVSEDYTLRIFKGMKDINQYEVIEGKDIHSDSDMLISQRFAEANDLKIGDDLTVKGKKFTIVGYMVKADYVYMLKNLSDSYYNYDKFGIAVVNEAAIKEIGNYISYYSICFNESNNLKFRQEVNEKYKIISYVSSSTNTRIDYTYGAGNDVFNMSMYFAPVLFIIVMAITALILSRKVKSERHHIGILAALGYRKKELIAHYGIYAAIPAVAGSALGIVLGALCTKPFSELYFGDFEKLPYSIKLNSVALAVSIIVPFILYTLVAVFIVRKLLKSNAIELLNGMAVDKDSRLKRLFTDTKIKFKTKYKVRLILGHLSRTFVVILGVVSAGTCILTGFAMKDAINNAIDYSLASKDYNNVYYLRTYVEDVPDAAEGIIAKSFEVKGSKTLFQVWGIENNSHYIKIKLLSGKSIEYGKYYMSNAIAKTYGVKQGDKFTFYDIASAEEKTITIADIADDNINAVVFTSRENAADFAGCTSGESNIFVSDTELDLEDSVVTNRSTKTAMKESIEEVMGTFMVICYAVIVIGFLLGVMVMYLVTNLIVEESTTNISMLKILGYRQKEINSMVLNVNHILVLIGFALSIPVTILICKAGFADSINSMGMYVPVDISATSYVFCFACVLCAYFVSLALLKKKTARVDMVACLKSSRE